MPFVVGSRFHTVPKNSSLPTYVFFNCFPARLSARPLYSMHIELFVVKSMDTHSIREHV